MDSFANDHRFSRAFTDPRFRPMPTLQKKVKIDNRFKAVLSSKDYGHRVLLDKRGRPIHDISKRGKHEMERYYQISSDDSSSSGEEDEDEVEESEAEAENYTNKQLSKLPGELTESDADSDTPVAKTTVKKQKNKDSTSNKKSTKRKGDTVADNEDDTTTKKKKAKDKVKAAELKPSRKKRSLDDQEADEENAIEKRPVAKRLKKQTEVKSAKTKLSKKSPLVDEEEEKRRKNESNQKFTSKQSKMKEQIVSDDDDDDGEDEEDSDEDEKDLSSSSDSDDSSNEEDGEDSGEEIDTSQCVPIMRKSTSVDHSWNELHRKAPIVSESTHRLAVCNMDWDFVKAQDLFVLFKSFVGEGGSVRSVTIYPSEFGKERMAEDATYGPREMRVDLNGLDSEDDSEESDSEEAKRKKNRRIDSEILKRKAKEAAKAQNEVLRGYQLNRLRYYFAVVDCNSVEAADAIYKECDGMEYQLSSLRLDLRYIPDDMTFDDPPKDSFSDEQGLVDFKPNYFLSTALSQGKVNVTWDETEFDRIRNKITNAQREELEQIVEENRYADTIAPPESDSDFEDDERPQWLKTALGGESDDDDDDNGEAISEEKKISLYRKVLMDKLVEDEEKEEKKTEVDKEMEWTAGLKTDYESKLKRREKIKEESQGVMVDKYLERKREKRRKRLQKKAELARAEGGSDGEDNDGEDHSDNDMPDIIDDSLKEMMASEGHDVNSIKSKKKTKPDKKKAAKKKDEDDSEAERERAQLELLLMRDDDEKKLEKPEVVKNKLSRRQKKKISMLKSEKRKQRKEGRLTLDVEDQRFGAMFTSHHFHIDPNHGQFRKTKNNMKLLDEQIKRMSKAKKDNAGKHVEGQLDRDEDSRNVSKKLVESLKSKMKK